MQSFKECNSVRPRILVVRASSGAIRLRQFNPRARGNLFSIKTLSRAIPFLMVCVALAGESGTYIGPHRIGESFHEWLAINKIDVAYLCRDYKPNGVPSLATMLQDIDCKQLFAIRDTGQGWFNSEDKSTKQVFVWRFTDGKAARAEAHFPGLETKQQIGFLTETYGPPGSSKTVTYQNAFGAKWECLEADWIMADGAIILAHESIQDARRVLNVTFISKDYLDANKVKQAKPNPYAK